MAKDMRNAGTFYVEDELDETVAVALGELSMRACAFDGDCEAAGIPAHVGDYLLTTYGDDEAGLQRAREVIRLSNLVAKGTPPASGDVVSRVSGARRMDGDVYALSTPCPRLYMLGLEGSAVRAERLLDGSWCHLATSKRCLDDGPSVEVFELDDSTGEFSHGEAATYSIDGIRVIRNDSASIGRLLDLRSRLSTAEWVLLLLRSYGFDGDELDAGERLCMLSRLVPLAQPGLRALIICGEGRTRACELSPYECSAEYLQSEYDGFPGSWDCIVTGGEEGRGAYALSSLLDGYEGIATGVSLAVVSDGRDDGLRRASRLYGPFHIVVETPQDSSRKRSLGASHLGINRCLLGELWHAIRGQDLLEKLSQAVGGVARQLVKEDEGTRLTFEGMAKVLYPKGEMAEDEGRELLEFVLEKMR